MSLLDSCLGSRHLVLTLQSSPSGMTVGGTVRDFMIIFGVVASLTSGFFVWRNHFMENQQSASYRKQVKNHITGDSSHERSNSRRSSKKRDLNPSQGAAGEASESAELSDFAQAEEFVEEDFDVLLSSEQDRESPVVVGVPIAAWVRARINRFKDAPAPQKSPQHLRVFLGCMELKKGQQKPDKYLCEKILASRDAKLAGERGRY